MLLRARIIATRVAALLFVASCATGLWIPATAVAQSAEATVGDNDVVVDGSEVVLRFVAPASGRYTFYTTGSSDTVGTLYDNEMSVLVADDDGGDDYNFRISYALEGGVTYHVGVGLYSYSSSTTVSLTIADQSSEPSVSVRDVDLYDLDGTSTTLKGGYGATKRFIIVGRPGCYNTRTTVGRALDASESEECSGVMFLVLDVDDDRNTFASGFGDWETERVRFFSPENGQSTSYNSWAWTTLRALGGGSGSVTLPFVFLVDENDQVVYGGNGIADVAGLCSMYFAQESGPDLSRDGWVDLADGAKGYARGGALVTGWMDLNGAKYWFDAQGRMATGWTDVEVNGKTMHYYFNPASGNLARGTWMTIDGQKYYFRPSGNMATGFADIDDNGVTKKYYFDESGQMLTGWQDVELNGKVMHYYFRPAGSMATGWATIDGEKHYFRASGNMATGWADVSGNKHYFDAEGRMLTGWQTISGKRYYFRASGAMQTGTATIGGKTYEFSDSGVLIGEALSTQSSDGEPELAGDADGREIGSPDEATVADDGSEN